MKRIRNPRKGLHPKLSRVNVEDAFELINKILDWDFMSWNVIISSFVQQSHIKDTLKLYF